MKKLIDWRKFMAKKKTKAKATDVFGTRYQKRKFEEYWKLNKKAYYETDTGRFFIENGIKNSLKASIAADIAGKMKKNGIKLSKALLKEEHSTIFKSAKDYGRENFISGLYKNAPEILKKIKDVIQMPDKRKNYSFDDFQISYNGEQSRMYHHTAVYHFYYQIDDGYSVEFDVKMASSPDPRYEIINIRYNGKPTTKVEDAFVKGNMHGKDNREWIL